MREYRLSSEGVLGLNSTGGRVLKWKIGDTYIKTSTLGVDAYGRPSFMYESLSEVIISKVGKALGYDIVDYKLCKIIIDNELECIGCESKDFAKGMRYVSFGKLIVEHNLKDIYLGDLSSYTKLINYYGTQCSNLREYIDNNLTLDYITLNNDRHYGNFGLLVDDKGKVRTASIFDNGNGLLGNGYADTITYARDISKIVKAKPFSYDWERQIALVENKTKINSNKVLGVVNKELDKMRQLKVITDGRVDFIKYLIEDRINLFNSKAN